MKRGLWIILALTLGLGVACPVPAARLKDVAGFKGIRGNQLIGYGLVVGLNGTGDESNNAEFTVRSVANMLERMGIHIDPIRIGSLKLKNIAAVMVTATLPAFARAGSRIDLLVSSMGDAKSLQGGTLLITPLKGVDQQVYALAQGPIVVGGFSASGASGSGVQKNHPTVGAITKGAVIEREVPVDLEGRKELVLYLFNPDFTTAEKVKETINRSAGEDLSRAVDSGTVQIRVPAAYQGRVADWIAFMEKLDVTPDSVAKVILNERTGTVVLGENVRISTVAIAHGNLSIQIKEKLNVSQPLPLAPGAPAGTASVAAPPGATGSLAVPGGATVVTPESNVTVKEGAESLLIVPAGASLGDVVRALNAIGVTPRDLIAILQSIKAAGALQADLEII